MPKPFCRIIVCYGSPIDQSLSFEAMAEALKNQLNQLEQKVTQSFENWSELDKNNP
jgi:lysophospholipid acyltransferase (LPLAT)-like uncharacterized protein